MQKWSLYMHHYSNSSSTWMGYFRWHQNIHANHSEDYHNQINKILTDSSSIFLPAEGWQDEEQSNPDENLLSHKHSSAAEQKRDEWSSVGLFLKIKFLWIEKNNSSGVFIWSLKVWHVLVIFLNFLICWIFIFISFAILYFISNKKYI